MSPLAFFLGQSQCQESAAKGQEKSHKSEPGPGVLEGKKTQNWELWQHKEVGEPPVSSLGSQGAVLGLAEVCPDAQNRHKCAKDPPTEHRGH